MPADRQPGDPGVSRRVAVVVLAGVLAAAASVLAPPPAARAAAPSGTDRLLVGAALAPGGALKSPNGVFTLTLQTDGNVVEYAGGRVMWTSSTRGRGGVRLTLQTDGNLVLYDAANAPVWATYRTSPAPATLLVRDDGGLVAVRTDGTEYWGVHPRADLLPAGTTLVTGQSLFSPGAGYRLTLQTDGNLVLYSSTDVPVWATMTFGTNPVLSMQSDGNLVLRGSAGGAVFVTGTRGQNGAGLSVGTAASVVVGVGTAVAWRSPAKPATVWRGQLLASGKAIVNGNAALTMQTDGNLVRRDASGRAVWATYTASVGAYASMQGDGNLVVRSAVGATLWASGTRGTTATFLQVSPAGMAFLGNASRSPNWIEGPPNWTALARCESGGNPRAVNPAGYYGLYQFDLAPGGRTAASVVRSTPAPPRRPPSRPRSISPAADSRGRPAGSTCSGAGCAAAAAPMSRRTRTVRTPWDRFTAPQRRRRCPSRPAAGTPEADPGDVMSAPAAGGLDPVDPVDPLDPADRGSLLPAWFEVGVVVVTAAVLAVGSAGLIAALLGRYGLVPALLWGLLGTVVLSAVALRGLRRRSGHGAVTGRSAQAPAIAMCVVASVSMLYNGLRAGHYVFVDRDPGIYAVAARWLARTGSLQVQGGAPWIPVARTTNYASAGMYPEPGGVLEFQFNHLLPTLLAVAQGVGGDRLLFAGNAVIGAVGLLMVYAVGVRLGRNPWLVAAAVTALGLTLPELLFSRDTYSEPLTQLLLWSGMWLVLTSWERRRFGLAALGGLALGATVMARVDALLYLGLLPVLAGGVVAAVPRVDRRFAATWAATTLLAAAPTALLGSVDVQVRAGGYYADLKSNIDGLRLLVVASVVAGVLVAVVGPRLPRLVAWAVGWRPRLGVGAGVFVTVVLALVWTLRPSLQHPVGVSNTTTAALQAREGVPVAPTLTYSENSLTWFSWYLGPIVLTLAVVGLGVLTARAVRGHRGALLVLAVTGPAAALYLYAVSNTPDQVWVMRRYVPAVLPLFVLAAVVALEAAVGMLPPRPWPAWVTRSAPVAAMAALLAFPLGTLIPVRDFSTQAGYLPAIDATCDRIGPDAAVAFASNDIDGIVLTQTLRSFCGATTTRLVGIPSADELAAIVAAARSNGRVLWVLGSSQTVVAKAVGSVGVAERIAEVTNDRKLAVTLTRLPDGYESQTMAVWGARIG